MFQNLGDDEVQSYLTNGSIDVGGHTLTTGDLRVMYAFEGERSEELSQKYEAHSDNDVSTPCKRNLLLHYIQFKNGS